MRRIVNDSIIYNASLVLFTIAKIAVSITVLLKYDTKCHVPYKLWTFLMISHDVLYIMGQISLIKTISTVDYDDFHLENRHHMSRINQRFGDEEEYDESSITIFCVSEHISRTRELLPCLMELIKAYPYKYLLS